MNTPVSSKRQPTFTTPTVSSPATTPPKADGPSQNQPGVAAPSGQETFSIIGAKSVQSAAPVKPAVVPNTRAQNVVDNIGKITFVGGVAGVASATVSGMATLAAELKSASWTAEVVTFGSGSFVVGIIGLTVGCFCFGLSGAFNKRSGQPG